MDFFPDEIILYVLFNSQLISFALYIIFVCSMNEFVNALIISNAIISVFISILPLLKIFEIIDV